MSELDEDARAQIAEVLATVAEQGLDGPRDTDVALDAIEAVITAIPTEQDALRAENARLREAQNATTQLMSARGTNRDYWEATAHKLEAENVRLREALLYYAQDYDYERFCSQWDGGAKARAALKVKP
jgi:hypothetical protein